MSVTNLIKLVKKVKESDVKHIIESRIAEFKNIGSKSSEEIFKELCFCILTANFDAAKCIMIQRRIGRGFIELPEKELAIKLKELGHRFPNTRAKYISLARKHKEFLATLFSSSFDDNEIREWLVKNIKGVGYKEASHFLRNIGYKNCAIIDFHIIDLLVKHKIIRKPSSISKKKYLEIESILREMSNRLKLTPAELDLYLWYIETGNVLK